MAHDFPSTNDANRDAGHPHVDETGNGPGTVTLTFTNDANEFASFEYRLDGAALTEGEPHPVVEGDFLYPTIDVDGRAQEPPVVQEFEAESTVEVRLALGGERDWDFDWTPFAVGDEEPPPPPPSIDLTVVQDAVTENGDVVQSAVMLLSGLADAIRASAGDEAAVTALAEQLHAFTQSLAEAVTANTPVG